MIKRIIYTTLLIIWMIVIFMFSNATAQTSQKTSDNVAKTVIETAAKVTHKEVTKEQKEKMIKDTRFYVRKLAHFTLYFILGVLIYLTLTSYNINKRIIVYSILFCFIYAISDEAHQLFRNGRSSKVLDIIIDTTGSVTGIVIINIINKKIMRRKALIK